MSIRITDAPSLAPSPGFAGATIRVPLNEEPSAAWLDHLRRQELPGKAHRANGQALEFYLDRDARDVVAAMRRLAKAIESANDAYAATAEDDKRREEREQSGAEARRDKADRLLAEWWEAEKGKVNPQAAPAKRDDEESAHADKKPSDARSETADNQSALSEKGKRRSQSR